MRRREKVFDKFVKNIATSFHFPLLQTDNMRIFNEKYFPIVVNVLIIVIKCRQNNNLTNKILSKQSIVSFFCFSL